MSGFTCPSDPEINGISCRRLIYGYLNKCSAETFLKRRKTLPAFARLSWVLFRRIYGFPESARTDINTPGLRSKPKAQDMSHMGTHPPLQLFFPETLQIKNYMLICPAGTTASPGLYCWKACRLSYLSVRTAETELTILCGVPVRTGRLALPSGRAANHGRVGAEP